MKKSWFFLFFLIGGLLCGPAVKAQTIWQADFNTDTVTTGYKIYRTDGSRALVATVAGQIDGKIDVVAVYSWADGSNPTEAEITTQIDALAAGTAP